MWHATSSSVCSYRSLQKWGVTKIFSFAGCFSLCSHQNNLHKI